MRFILVFSTLFYSFSAMAELTEFLDFACQIQLKKTALIEYLTTSPCGIEACIRCSDLEITSPAVSPVATGKITCGYPSDLSIAVDYEFQVAQPFRVGDGEEGYCQIELNPSARFSRVGDLK